MSDDDAEFALTEWCRVCNAEKGEPCRNIIDGVDEPYPHDLRFERAKHEFNVKVQYWIIQGSCIAALIMVIVVAVIRPA